MRPWDGLRRRSRAVDRGGASARPRLSLPPPLRGRAGVGGTWGQRLTPRTPTLALPRKGGGNKEQPPRKGGGDKTASAQGGGCSKTPSGCSGRAFRRLGHLGEI